MINRLADALASDIEKALNGMQKGVIYDTSNMQIIWLQYAKDCNSILISQDDGITWINPPYVDSGKWYYKGWLFKLK